MRTLKELIDIKKSLEAEQRELRLKLSKMETDLDNTIYEELRLRANIVDRKLFKFNRRIANL